VTDVLCHDETIQIISITFNFLSCYTNNMFSLSICVDLRSTPGSYTRGNRWFINGSQTRVWQACSESYFIIRQSPVSSSSNIPPPPRQPLSEHHVRGGGINMWGGGTMCDICRVQRLRFWHAKRYITVMWFSYPPELQAPLMLLDVSTRSYVKSRHTAS
jgi:hypothetical protein